MLLLTLVYGAVGLYDDYLKVTKQSAEGFRGRIKIIIEAAAAVAATAVIAEVGEPPLATELAIPFFKYVELNPRLVLYPVRRVHHRGCRQRGKPNRRTRRPCLVPVMIAAATFGFISYLVGNLCLPNISKSISCRGPVSLP